MLSLKFSLHGETALGSVREALKAISAKAKSVLRSTSGVVVWNTYGALSVGELEGRVCKAGKAVFGGGFIG